MPSVDDNGGKVTGRGIGKVLRESHPLNDFSSDVDYFCFRFCSFFYIFVKRIRLYG